MTRVLNSTFKIFNHITHEKRLGKEQICRPKDDKVVSASSEMFPVFQ